VDKIEKKSAGDFGRFVFNAKKPEMNNIPQEQTEKS
jgi:hypothetical protein